MDITPLIKADRMIIESYAPGRVTVSGHAFESGVVVLPDMAAEWPVTKPVKDMTREDFSPLIERADDIDVVLLGGGARPQFPAPSVRQELRREGLVIETMDTGAACRTYNVLMADGRRVAAAVITVSS